MQDTASADPSSPLETILVKIITGMKSQNEVLAESVLNGAIALFHAQTSKARLGATQLDEYFEFRFRDVGGEYVITSILYLHGRDGGG